MIIKFILICSLLVILFGCASQSPVDVEEEDASCEYDAQQNFNAFYDYFENGSIHDGVQEVFDKSTSTYLKNWKFKFDLGTYQEPNYIDVNSFFIDGIISDGNPETLLGFITRHKNTNAPYHLLSCEKYIGNINGLVYGGLSEGNIEPNKPPVRKWSIVFVGDIRSTNWQPFDKGYVIRHVICHELGHQITSLTHPREHPEYHAVTKDNEKKCIMDRLLNAVPHVDPYAKFCNGTDDNQNSCMKYIKKVRP